MKEKVNVEDIKLNDIADDLVILNKATVDTLYRLDNCSDCIALYIFYYKTAKWQKTNTIKANDMYVKKSLKWGSDKIKRTKETLKEHGLINIVRKTKENGQIDGWFVEVSYIVTMKKADDIKVKILPSTTPETTTPESHNTQKPQVADTTSGNEDINALKEYIKCLKKEIEMLKDNNKVLKDNKEDIKEVKQNQLVEAEIITPFTDTRTDLDKIKIIVNYLNVRAGTNYKETTKATQTHIKARFKEGYVVKDFLIVIDKKCQEWLNDSKMSKYLRPETLFGSKFESYLNQPVKVITTKDIAPMMDFSDIRNIDQHQEDDLF